MAQTLSDIQVLLLAILALAQLVVFGVLHWRALGMIGKVPAAPPPVPPAPPIVAPSVPTAAAKPAVPPTQSAGPPPWLTWAQHEIGFHETGENQGIEKYIALAHCGAPGDPWCAIFANAALEATGTPGTRSAASQSFRTHPGFIQLQAPVPGALAVFWRVARNSGQGHVGFYVGEDATHVSTLGGNENDAVRIEPLPKAGASFGLIGYWWPKSVPLPAGGAVTVPTKAPEAAKPVSTAPAHQTGITATVFGGQQSAYGGPIDDNSPGVALPFRFSGERPRVRVTSKTAAVECAIVDVGPWNINDPYWQAGQRPQAETGTDMTGRKTNRAGIDLTLAAAQALAIDGKGLVDWEFVESPLSSAPKVT
jgi:uncharacterized protein (TIGR02594 family)